MARLEITLEDLEAGIELATGEVHTLVIRRSKAAIVEMDDLNFHFGSAVVLPVAPPRGDWREGAIGGLDCISRGLRYGQESGYPLTVIGHTDTSGSDAANRILSELRAENTRCLLVGDKDAWAASSQEAHRIEDLQVVLTWARYEFGWDCGPGPVDNDDGPATRSGLARFRDQYDASFGGSLPRALDLATIEDWKAIFHLYEIVLADRLDLAACRGALQFNDPPTVGAGESWPVSARGKDNVRSSTNRRVELVFFEKPPTDLSATEPPASALYGSNSAYKTIFIPVDPAHRFFFSV